MIESLAGESELVQQPHDAATSTAAAAADVTLSHGRLQFTDGREVLNSSVDGSVSITTSTRRARYAQQVPRQGAQGEKNIRFGEWVRVPVDDDAAIRQRRAEAVADGAVKSSVKDEPLDNEPLCTLEEMATSDQWNRRFDSMKKVILLMHDKWHLKAPSMILEVTGSAVNVSLRPEERDIFASALTIASKRTRSWIVTGGTDNGIMAAVGDALAARHATTPCIGISTWGCVRTSSALLGSAGGGEQESGAVSSGKEDEHVAAAEVNEEKQQFAGKIAVVDIVAAQFAARHVSETHVSVCLAGNLDSGFGKLMKNALDRLRDDVAAQQSNLAKTRWRRASLNTTGSDGHAKHAFRFAADAASFGTGGWRPDLQPDLQEAGAAAGTLTVSLYGIAIAAAAEGQSCAHTEGQSCSCDGCIAKQQLDDMAATCILRIYARPDASDLTSSDGPSQQQYQHMIRHFLQEEYEKLVRVMREVGWKEAGMAGTSFSLKRAQQERAQNPDTKIKQPPKHSTYSLEKNHSHYILVDDGSRGEREKEVEFTESRISFVVSSFLLRWRFAVVARF